MEEKGDAVSRGMSIMRAELDATTSTSLDTHEAQWRAGVNRQAQPDAHAQRVAAACAAAAKRTANAMSVDERRQRRAESKRAARQRELDALSGHSAATTQGVQFTRDHMHIRTHTRAHAHAHAYQCTRGG